MEIETRSTRSASVNIRLDPALRRQAEAAATAAGVSLSDLVRHGIRLVTRETFGTAAKARDLGGPEA